MAFRRVHADDKALPSEPSRCLMAWCPSMDLIALVVGENLIAVHRLSWGARLFTFEDSSPVSALCWSPDGRTLASGHDDGRLTLYDVEGGDAISSTQAHSSRITSLHWAANSSRKRWASDASVPLDELCKDRASTLLPPLPQTEGTGSSSTGESSDFKGGKQRSIHELTVLLSGDANGVVSVRMLGTFCVGSVQVCLSGDAPSSSGGRRAGLEVRDMCLSDDLACISVLVHCTGEAGKDVEGARKVWVVGPNVDVGSGFLSIFGTDTLASRAPQLLLIASQSWMMQCIITSLEGSLETMKKQWKDAKEHTAARIQSLQQSLQDHASTTTVEGELLTSVATGCASAALQNFLTNLRENGVRRWEKAVDTGCTNLQTQISQRILPGVQALIFRAGELQGLARWEERYANIGLGEDAVGTLVSTGGLLMARTLELFAATKQLQQGIAHFCRWLQKVAMRLLNDSGSTSISPEEALNVSTFISSQLSHDSVAFFLDSDASAPEIFSEMDAEKAPSALQLLLSSDADITSKAAPKEPLPALLERVRQSASLALVGTRNCIAESLQLENTMVVYSGDKAGAKPPAKVCCASDQGDEKDLSCTVTLMVGQDKADAVSGVRALRIVRSEGQERAAFQISGAFFGTGEEKDSLVDVGFYGTEAAAMLFAQGDGRDAASGSLCLLKLEEVGWTPMARADAQAPGGDLQVLESMQTRQLESAAPAKLAVNGKRGLGCVLLRDPWRVTLFDMEDEEGDGDDEMEEDDD